MIRIRAGDRWKEQVGGRAEVLPERALGALGIEIDGVDISGGVLEDRLFPSAAALAEAAAALVSGEERTAGIPFAEGAFELVLARRPGTALLSLVSLSRPARVLVRDVAVEMPVLAAAVLSFGEELLQELRAIDPSALRSAGARRLSRACRRLLRARDLGTPDQPVSPAQLHSIPSRGGQAPSVAFDMRDADGRLSAYAGGEDLHALLPDGHVYLHGPDGEELGAASGPPYLVLRDLGEAAYRLLVAVREGDPAASFPLGSDGPNVEVDLRGEAFTVAGRTLSCSPEALAAALLEGVLDFTGALLARNARLGDHPYLSSLAEEARERLELCRHLSDDRVRPVSTPREPPRPGEEPRFLPGDLRKVALRTVWRAELGETTSFHRAGPVVWVVGEDGAQAVAVESGERLTRLPGAMELAVVGAGMPLLARAGEALLVCGPAGEPGARVALPPIGSLGPVAFLLRPPGAEGLLAALVDGRVLVLADRQGTARFVLEPPGAVRAAMAASGSLLAMAADNGVLYGVDAGPCELAFRLSGSAPFEHVAVAGSLVVAAGEAGRSVRLLGASAQTGEKAFEIELPLTRVGSLLATTSGVLVSGVGTVGGEVLKVDSSGRIRWRARPILGPDPPHLLRTRGAVFARGAQGACRIERGRVRFSVPCEPGGAPLLVRGVLALPGERLTLFDAATGRPLPAASPPLAADHLASHGGTLLVADEDGAAVGLKLSGGLAVL